MSTKTKKLKEAARTIAAGAAGIGGGVLASRIIQKNKRSAASKVGWATRKKSSELRKLGKNVKDTASDKVQDEIKDRAIGYGKAKLRSKDEGEE